MKNSRYLALITRLSLLLCVVQLLLIIGSWMINALWPQTGVRSLLSSEGVRWFFGHFVDMMTTAPMAWLLLLGIAWGVWRYSRLGEGLHLAFSHLFPSTPTRKKTSEPIRRTTVRHHFALIVVVAELLAFVVLMLLLSLMPHAILLSASGTLFPSSFSASIVPYVAFALTVMAATYGLIVGTLPSLYHLYRAACKGLSAVAPLLLLSIFVAQFVFSLFYVFGQRIPFASML